MQKAKFVKQYRHQRLFAIKSFSIGLLIVMIAYYAIVLFHLPSPIKLIESGRFSKGLVHYITILFLFSLIGAGGKLGLLLVGGWLKGKRPNLFQAFFSMTFFLIGIGATLFSFILLFRFAKRNISISYWNTSHWFWVALLLFLFFSFLFLLFRKYSLINKEALDNLRSIPIVSPIFCFGGPYFFSQNLAFKNLPPDLLKPYYIISFSAGIIFLVFLIVNAFYKAKPKNDTPLTKKIILIPDGTEDKITESKDYLLSINYLLLGLGTYLFCFLVIDMSIMLII